MKRILSLVLFCIACGIPCFAQPPARRIADLTAEIAQLKVKLADQEERIAQLEAAMKALQASSVPAPIPAVTPPWYVSTNWLLIKPGMSRMQILEILGAPTRETAVLDTQTLYYSSDARSTTSLSATITLVGDRLTAMTPPAFQK